VPESSRYRALDVPVRGGDLRVGVWDAVGSTDENAAAPTVIAVHGITASHRCWPTVAAALPEFRVIAPDLRGRGRSRDLPGPYGMAQHTDDIAAVMDHLEVPRAVILGHSMGGFVTVAMHARHPDRVSAVVLADGGLPFEVPAGMSRDDYVDAVLGLVKQRLSMTFPDRDSYRQFFRDHPAFAGHWSDAIADYVDYDLAGDPPNLISATVVAAMAGDSVDQDDLTWLVPALEKLPDPTPFLRSPRDLANREPGLWSREWAASWQQRIPALKVREVPGINHYTMLFLEPGVSAFAEAVRGAAGRPARR
jgi:pimeloyl-ACP methyl ester carboxylesterase